MIDLIFKIKFYKKYYPNKATQADKPMHIVNIVQQSKCDIARSQCVDSSIKNPFSTKLAQLFPDQWCYDDKKQLKHHKNKSILGRGGTFP